MLTKKEIKIIIFRDNKDTLHIGKKAFKKISLIPSFNKNYSFIIKGFS